MVTSLSRDFEALFSINVLEPLNLMEVSIHCERTISYVNGKLSQT